MPGPAVHNIIGWQLADEFDRQAGTVSSATERQWLTDAATLARRYPAHVALGTQGPDFLFFNTADWNGALGTVANTYLKFVDAIRDIKRWLHDAFPILEEMSEMGDRIDEAGSKNSHVYQEFKRLGTTLSSTVGLVVARYQAEIKAAFLDEVNVFSILAHPFQVCEPTSEWWWFDTLHYRKTGQFAAKLLEKASERSGAEADKLRAYAIGYLSHVAGDTIGHPYVNTIVRGPYRTHAQRHKVVENYQDAWAYAVYHGEEPDSYGVHDDVVREVIDELRADQELDDEDLKDLTSSRLHLRQHLMTDDSTEHNQWTELPSYISDAFASAANDLYGDDEVEEFDLSRFEAEDVDGAYRNWYRWFSGATESGTIEAELPDWEPPTDPAQSAWDDFVDSLKDLGQAFEDLWNGIKNAFSGDGSSGLDFGGVINLLETMAEAVLQFAMVAVSGVEYLLSLPIKALNEVLRLLLESVYQGLYNSYETFHQMVALLGFGYPLRHQIMRRETEHFVYPFRPDALDNAIGFQNENNEFMRGEWAYPMQAVGKAGGAQYEFDEEGLSSLDSTGHLTFPYADRNHSKFVERSNHSHSVDEKSVTADGQTVPGPAAYLEEWPAYYIDGRSYRETVDHVDRYGDGFSETPAPGEVGTPTRTWIDREIIDLLGALPTSQEQHAVDALSRLQEPPATATGLTVEYYRRAMDGKSLPDVNLDGDRGFGFGTWTPAECPLPEQGFIDSIADPNSLDDTVTPIPRDQGQWTEGDG